MTGVAEVSGQSHKKAKKVEDVPGPGQLRHLE